MPNINTMPPCAYCGQRSHLSQDCADCPKSLRSTGDYMTSGRYGYIGVAAIPGVTPELVSMPPMPAWNQRDEEELRTVRATLAELEARRAHAVAAITRATNELFHAGATQEEFVAHMIEHADDIRDALAPFAGKDRAA